MRPRICFEAQEVLLGDGETLIGRDQACQLRIEDGSVSRRHARLLVVNGTASIEDLGSTNGVWINDRQVTGATLITAGDRVKLGSYEFTIEDGEQVAVEEETHRSLPSTQYQEPVYRTCIGCRSLLHKGEARCPRCGAEQPAGPYPTMRLWRDPQGRRRHLRRDVKLRGLYISGSLTVEGEVSDISHGGAFFACELLDEVGTLCDLLVFPAPDSDVVRFSGEVVRVSGQESRRCGLGIKFTHMSGAAQVWLLELMEATQD